MFGLIIISCSEDTPISSENLEELQPVDKYFDIEKLKSANNEEIDLISKFITQNFSSKNTTSKINSKFDKPEVVSYTNLPGKTIVLNYKNDGVKDISERAIILVVNEDNEIITNYKHKKIDYGSYYTVKTYIEGNKWFNAKIKKDCEEIIEFNLKSGVSLKTSFRECAETAVKACVNDGECAFICGILWKYCLGSIGLACAYHAI